METIGNLWLYVVFFGMVTVMLLIDFLGFKQKQDQMSQLTSGLLEYCMGHCSSIIWWRFMALPATDSGRQHRQSENHGILRRLFT
jgi:hypothetical protein